MGRWPLGAETGSRVTATKNGGTSVLQRQGSEFCV